MTLDLLGHPLQIRNFKGELKALSNVCAHRHCLLNRAARGNSAALKCPYHGWEYGPSGATRKIPAPENFVPLKPKPKLPGYRLEGCGQLLFVCLDSEAPSLRKHLGALFEKVESRFGAEWTCAFSWNPSYQANWKIPVENSLEAYHVEAIHPQTFGHSPTEQKTEHELQEGRTALKTRLPFGEPRARDRWIQICESGVMSWLGAHPSGTYQQHHLFPNLLFSFTDAISLCHSVVPTGPRSSRATVRQFARVGPRPGRRWVGRLWGRVSSTLTERIMKEDLPLFEQIQKGMEGSPHTGVLGRCEERIHAFHSYLVKGRK